MPEIICPNCGKQSLFDSERPVFCSKCGQRFTEGGDDESSMLSKAAAEKDYAKKHELLLKVLEKYPGSLEAEKQLLYLGRLWERGGKPDFYRIPYWPLSVFETPRSFSARQREEMMSRFFDNPELERVAELMPDKEAFMNDYIEYMCRCYVDLFIKGSSANSTFLGFRRKPEDVMRRSAACVMTILKNIDKCDELDNSIKIRLEWSFVRGFGRVFEAENGEEYLKSRLK